MNRKRLSCSAQDLILVAVGCRIECLYANKTTFWSSEYDKENVVRDLCPDQVLHPALCEAQKR